jgi:hypothetical protein
MKFLALRKIFLEVPSSFMTMSDSQKEKITIIAG